MLTYAAVSRNTVIQVQTYNQLNRITKRSIQKPTQGLPKLHRYLFGRKRKDSRQRNNSKEIEDENSRRIPAHSTSNYTQRHEYQEDIDIVAVQCHFSNIESLCRNPHELILTVHSNCMILVRKKLEERRQRTLFPPTAPIYQPRSLVCGAVTILSVRHVGFVDVRSVSTGSTLVLVGG